MKNYEIGDMFFSYNVCGINIYRVSSVNTKKDKDTMVVEYCLEEFKEKGWDFSYSNIESDNLIPIDEKDGLVLINQLIPLSRQYEKTEKRLEDKLASFVRNGDMAMKLHDIVEINELKRTILGLKTRVEEAKSLLSLKIIYNKE